MSLTPPESGGRALQKEIDGPLTPSRHGIFGAEGVQQKSGHCSDMPLGFIRRWRIGYGHGCLSLGLSEDHRDEIAGAALPVVDCHADRHLSGDP